MSEFYDCLKKRSLVRFEGSPDVVAREIEAAHQDLDDAGLMVTHQQWKRLTITAYYCMFHAARALILRAGYAEKSHFCLGVAFRELYATTPDGLELAMGLERARVLRENADYRSDFDEAGARAALVVAERFVRFADDALGLGPVGR